MGSPTRQTPNNDILTNKRNPFLDPDPIFASPWYKKLNPRGNEPTFDYCTRRLPLFLVRRELLEDAEKGGSRMVEAFVQGVYGTFGRTALMSYVIKIMD